MNYMIMKDQLKRDGFVVVRGLLEPDEARHYRNKMETLAHAGPTGAKKAVDKRGLMTSWTLPDGVVQTPDFWPIIYNEKLVEIVRQIVSPDIRFLQHNDLHVGFSAISWHRDSVNREFGLGPDWQEQAEPYRLVRVGIYLQSYAESGFRLGFIKGSHYPLPYITFRRRLMEARLKWIGALSYAFVKLQTWASNADWIATEPGDAIIFDPRTLHSGSYITGPKRSIFVAYGQENQHFYNHHNYYRHFRSELGYRDFDPALILALKERGLYQDKTPHYTDIPAAYTPIPVVRNFINRKVKAKG